MSKSGSKVRSPPSEHHQPTQQQRPGRAPRVETSPLKPPPSRSERLRQHLLKSPLFQPPKPKPPPPKIETIGGKSPGGARRLDLLRFASYCLILAFAIIIISGAQMIFAPEFNTQQLLNVQLGEIDGKIVYDSVGVPGVIVRIEDSNRSTITDANGEYRFDNVKSDDVVLIVEADGFMTERRNVTIAPRIFTDLDNREDFELVPGNGTIISGSYSPAVQDRVHEQLQACAVIIFVIGVLVLLSAVCTILRKRYPLALFGAVMGVLAITFWYIPTILCACAALLIILDRTKFK